MARRSAAHRAELPEDAKQEESAPAPAKRSRGRKANAVELDRTIHERVRLAIVSALAGTTALTFNELKTLIGATDGNLSVHARRLEEAGFIACDKSFDGRVPRTEYRITATGRRALNEYLDHMEALIRRVREG